MPTSTTSGNGRHAPEPGLVPVRMRLIDSIHPSPENLKLYRPVDADDPDLVALVESIKRDGVQEPLVVTLDNWILSGHRRHAAAQLAGVKRLPCRAYPIRRIDEPDRFLVLLREFNRQRVKSFDELLREEVVSVDPEEAYWALVNHRAERAKTGRRDGEVDLRRDGRARCEISPAKEPFLQAAQEVLEGLRKFWPVSDRRVHYGLLNNPPLRHASKPDSRYANDLKCWKDLCDLLTRARLEGIIPWEAIGDDTRVVETWNIFRNVQQFIRCELNGFLKGYWRDLMQSQPNHIEIVGEKNALIPIIRPVAAKYTIPITFGRGFCSIVPRHAMANRYFASGKEQLIVLCVTDFDPPGEEIAHSFGRSMRDDFAIENVRLIKVALNHDQVKRHGLPPGGKAKSKMGAQGYARFIAEHGTDANVYEVEALDPDVLQAVLADAIDSVIDAEAFNHELDTEKQDAARLEGVRRTLKGVLAQIDGPEAAP